MSADLAHTTVLLHEAVAALEIKPDGIYVDGKGSVYLVFHSPNARLFGHIADDAFNKRIVRNITGKEYQAEHHEFAEGKKQGHTGKH